MLRDKLLKKSDLKWLPIYVVYDCILTICAGWCWMFFWSLRGSPTHLQSVLSQQRISWLLVRAHNSSPCGLSSFKKLSLCCSYGWLSTGSPEQKQVCKASSIPTLKLKQLCLSHFYLSWKSEASSNSRSCEIHWKAKKLCLFFFFLNLHYTLLKENLFCWLLLKFFICWIPSSLFVVSTLSLHPLM